MAKSKTRNTVREVGGRGDGSEGRGKRRRGIEKKENKGGREEW